MHWPWRKAETDLEREVRYHLETMADGFERQGLSRTEALQRARREFGGVDPFKEKCRDEGRWQSLARFTQDLKFGIRLHTAVNFVPADYLRAVGVPIVAGRGLTGHDVRLGAKVAVVSEDVANGDVFEVVGVATRARYSELTRQTNVVYVPNTLGQDSSTVL
jgi:hypothetical protein